MGSTVALMGQFSTVKDEIEESPFSGCTKNSPLGLEGEKCF